MGGLFTCGCFGLVIELERKGANEIFWPSEVVEAAEQRIVFRHTEYSLEYLCDVKNTLNQLIGQPGWDGLQRAALREQYNRIKVFTTDMSQEFQNSVYELVGDAVIFKEVDRPYEIVPFVTILRGGDWLRRDAAGAANQFSLAAAVDIRHGRIGFLTAAHAVDGFRHRVYFGRTFIGQSVREVTMWHWNDNAGVDAAIIDRDANYILFSDRLINGDTLHMSPAPFGSELVGNLPVGSIVTKHGARTGTTSGNIINRNECCRESHGYIEVWHGLGGIMAGGGDSGGAVVFRQQVQGTHINRLTGIVQGGCLMHFFHPIEERRSRVMTYSDIFRVRDRVPFVRLIHQTTS